MSILVANLGTSDLSMQPQGQSYYLPIKFDRNEPNLVLPDPSSEDYPIWQQREELVRTKLCAELSVPLDQQQNFEFREFTRLLWEKYEAEPEQWHDRIRPGRIWGAIQAAQKFGVRHIYLFVTDQDPGHQQDTIYLFKILQQWIQREQPELKVKAEVIPKAVAAVDEDALFNCYYQFFTQVSRKLSWKSKGSDDPQELLISIKGGTYQMQTALRIQALSSAARFRAHLEPQLKVTDVLAGLPSQCRTGVYWRYVKNQIFQSVKLLLQKRWDFDGAEQLVFDWKGFLDRLIEYDIADQEIQVDQQQLQDVITVLRVANNCLNLDYWSAKYSLETNPMIAKGSRLDQLLLNEQYSKLLNLYTHCDLYWNMDQTANFFVRMSSFYEEVQLRLLEVLGGAAYLEGDDLSSWQIDANKLKQANLWEKFEALSKASPYPNRFNHHPFEQEPIYQLMGRDNKACLLYALLDVQTPEVRKAGEVVLQQLKSLDFWSSTRNKIIHNSEGPAKHRLQHHADYARSKNHPLIDSACEWHQIMEQMRLICCSELGLVNPQYRETYLSRNGSKRHYIYGKARHYIMQKLDQY